MGQTVEKSRNAELVKKEKNLLIIGHFVHHENLKDGNDGGKHEQERREP
jgi:hypothetical protein